MHGLEEVGYSWQSQGLTTSPVLAPGERVSPHRAPSKRFHPIGGRMAWGLATPWRITRRSEDVAVQLAAARYPPTRRHGADANAGSGCRTSSLYFVQDCSDDRIKKPLPIPPSFDCLLSRLQTVVGMLYSAA